MSQKKFCEKLRYFNLVLSIQIALFELFCFKTLALEPSEIEYATNLNWPLMNPIGNILALCK